MQELVSPMIPRVQIWHVALVLVFAFCQVIGTMCALPDISVAEGAAPFVEEGMACPMDGTTMCPPMLISSPERQIKHTLVMEIDHAMTLLGSTTVLTVQCTTTLSPWNSACSMVPVSIGSSSVLRI